MYRIAFISELYGETVMAENYYKMITSKYQNIMGLRLLAARGIYRLTKGKTYAKFDMKQAKGVAKPVAPPKTTTPTVVKPVVKDPYSNSRYRTGETADIFILKPGEEKMIPFDGIKGVGISQQGIVTLSPTTSRLSLKAVKPGKVEIMVKDQAGKEHTINVAVIDVAHLTIKDNYLIRGEGKKIMINELKKLTMDNDNLAVKAEQGSIILTAKKEGDVSIQMERKDGMTVVFQLKVYKPLEKTTTLNLKLLGRKLVKFPKLTNTVITKQGIVKISKTGDDIEMTATGTGETAIMLSGSDGARMTFKINVTQ